MPLSSNRLMCGEHFGPRKEKHFDHNTWWPLKSFHFPQLLNQIGFFFSHYRTQHLQQSLVDDNDKCTFSRDRKNWWLFSLLFFLLCLDAVACDLIVWAKRFITESCFFLNVLFRYNSVTLSLTASETKVSCHDFIKNAIDYRVFFLSFRLNIKVKSIDTYTKRA